MFSRRAENKGSDTPKRVAIAVVLLLGVQAPPSVPIARATDDYASLVSQLSVLVARRSALVAELATTDTSVGSLALRDFIATVRTPLAEQTQQAALFAAQQPVKPTTMTVDVPSFYRASAPGTLLGPHIPMSEAAIRRSLPAALARVVGLATPKAVAPRLPARYQSLGVASSASPDHAVEVTGGTVPLPELAAQARAPHSGVPAVVAPPWYSPTVLSGADAVDAYSSVITQIIPQVISAASPSSVAQSGLTENSRPISDTELAGLLGNYVIHQDGGAGTARQGRALDSATWVLSASRPLTNGTTLQVQSEGMVTSGRLRSVRYSVFTAPMPRLIQPAAPLQLNLDLRLAGSAVVTATEVLSNSTAVHLTVRVPNMLADPAIAALVRSEQGPLRELYTVVHEGTLVYSQVSPLYDARAATYEQVFAVAMKKNAVLEQAWWNQTQRWNRYEAALATWQQQAGLWKQYVASRTLAHRASRTATAVPGEPSATAILTATVTPRTRGIGIPGPGVFSAGRRSVHFSLLGVGGGSMAQAVAPAARTPIFADTPVPPSPVTGISATVIATASATATIGVTSSSVSATASSTIAPSLTKVVTQVSSPSVTPSQTATPTSALLLFTPESTPSAVSTLPATPAGQSSTRTETATPTNTFVPSATLTPTSSVSATGTASPVPSASSPTATATRSATATASATPSRSPVPSVSLTRVKSASSKRTATEVASPSATATGAIDAPPTPDPTATILAGGKSALLPPGPPPVLVKAPPAQPPYVALPAPLAPLPAWVDAPIDVTTAEEEQYVAYGVNAKGYADMTSSQLIAGGALNDLSGFLPPIQGVITTLWGGSTPWQSFHPGLDIAGPDGIPVRAAADGIVVFAGLAVPGDPTQSYGNCVVIEHNGHLSTLYGHMQIGLHGLQVQVGQVVRQGQIIGYEGQTGFATGPHVHFEMRLDNVQFDPLLLINESLIAG